MVRNTRELLLEFANYRSIEDLDSIIESLDGSLRHPAGVYLTALGRLPERLELCGMDRYYNAAEHLRSLLLGEEFQYHLMPALLRAFPELKRNLFVHIPKSAGSDLRLVLSSKCLQVDKTVTISSFLGKETLFEFLRDFVLHVNQPHREVFVCGHFTLSDYIGANLIRSGDRVCTILREPADRVISHVNFVLTALKQDPLMEQAHSRYWAECLGLSSLESVTFDEEFARFVLRNEAMKVEFQNQCCRYLGQGDATFNSSIYAAKASNLEIVLFEDYEEWLQENWNVSSVHFNVSEKFISYASLPDTLRAYIFDELIGEDLKLYQFVCRERATRPVAPRLSLAHSQA